LAVAGLAKSTYFYEKAKADPDAKNKEISERIASIFAGSRARYGVRRVCAQLRAEGIGANHKKVQRLMKKMGLKGIVKTVNYNSYRGTVGDVAPDLIIRGIREEGRPDPPQSDFSCGGPNRKWTTDVSQFSLPVGEMLPQPDQGHVHRRDRRVRPEPQGGLLPDEEDAGFGLLAASEPQGLIFHSDQGWQYQQRWYVEELRRRGIRQSMSRKGNCLDNCIMESFFGSMKREMFYGRESEYPDFNRSKRPSIHTYRGTTPSVSDTSRAKENGCPPSHAARHVRLDIHEVFAYDVPSLVQTIGYTSAATTAGQATTSPEERRTETARFFSKLIEAAGRAK
jgi:putative transposase